VANFDDVRVKFSPLKISNIGVQIHCSTRNRPLMGVPL